MSKSINFSELQKRMQNLLNEERKLTTLEIEADTLEDALKDAALELGVTYKDLDYEVIVSGKKNFLGYISRKWRILAYKSQTTSRQDFSFQISDAEETSSSSDGKFVVRQTAKGILLKVIAPLGLGSPVNSDDILHYLKSRDINKYNLNVINNAIKKASGTWIKIADIDTKEEESTLMNVNVSEDAMTVYINFTPPGLHGAEVIEDDIYAILKNHSIFEKAFLKDKIEEFVASPIYNEPIILAKGREAEKGRDAYVEFTQQGSFARNEELKIDEFKNVHKGDVIGIIHESEKGEDGFNVFGKLTEGILGADLKFIIDEKNIEIKDKKLVATSDGYLTIVDNRISVEVAYFIEGDVGPATGNIVNNGTVFISGSILDGFNVFARTGIQVKGTVGRSILKSRGPIVLYSGMNGKGEGRVSCHDKVYVKFIENTFIKAAKDIISTNGIVNSKVSSKTRVLCKGKKARIVGSSVFAKEEVSASSIGSEGNNETIIEVGYDPETKNILSNFSIFLKELEEREVVVSRDIAIIKKQLPTIKDKADRVLKLNSYNSLINEHKVLNQEIDIVKLEHNRLEKELDQTKVDGRVSVEGSAFPGIKLYIKGVFYELSKEYKNVTFVEDNGYIKTIMYVPIDDKDMKIEDITKD